MKIRKIITDSFLLIMAIHLIVFTAIGIFTPLGWRLLYIFLIGLAALLSVTGVLLLYARKHPEKRWVKYIPFYNRLK